MLCNVNFSNLENLLQRKQKTGRTRECISIFRASGGTNVEKFSKFGCGCGCGFDGFTGLPNGKNRINYTNFCKNMLPFEVH